MCPLLYFKAIYCQCQYILIIYERQHFYAFMTIMGGGGLELRTAIEGSFSAWGVSENRIAGSAAARLFVLTAVAIAIATRLFKFHEISVSNTSSSFVSSIYSLALNNLVFIYALTLLGKSHAEPMSLPCLWDALTGCSLGGAHLQLHLLSVHHLHTTHISSAYTAPQHHSAYR